MLFENNHVVSTHGKSTQEIVDLRFKEWEIRQRKEADERAALAAKMQENKRDIITAPISAPAAAHSIMPTVHKWLHKLHLE
jgi:hypothetical protein